MNDTLTKISEKLNGFQLHSLSSVEKDIFMILKEAGYMEEQVELEPIFKKHFVNRAVSCKKE